MASESHQDQTLEEKSKPMCRLFHSDDEEEYDDVPNVKQHDLLESDPIKDYEAMGFSVEPKEDCPHIDCNVMQPPDDLKVLGIQCYQCKDKEENMICMLCYKVFCGRVRNQHMMAHHQETGHKIVSSVADLSFWCYSCDSYVKHPKLDVIYTLMHHLKFGCPPGVKATEEDLALISSFSKSKVGVLSNDEVDSGKFTKAMKIESMVIDKVGPMQYAIILPLDYDHIKTYPAIIAVSGERQRHVSKFFQAWKNECRGWIMACPLLPDGQPLFMQGSEFLIHELATMLLSRFHIEGNKFHMVGTSNGGSSCLSVAIKWPELCHSITMVTGCNYNKGNLKKINGIVVDMWVGDADYQFCEAMRNIHSELKMLGHKPESMLHILPGVTHYNIGENIDMTEFWELMEKKRLSEMELSSVRPSVSSENETIPPGIMA